MVTLPLPLANTKGESQYACSKPVRSCQSAAEAMAGRPTVTALASVHTGDRTAFCSPKDAARRRPKEAAMGGCDQDENMQRPGGSVRSSLPKPKVVAAITPCCSADSPVPNGRWPVGWGGLAPVPNLHGLWAVSSYQPFTPEQHGCIQHGRSSPNGSIKAVLWESPLVSGQTERRRKRWFLPDSRS